MLCRNSKPPPSGTRPIGERGSWLPELEADPEWPAGVPRGRPLALPLVLGALFVSVAGVLVALLA